MMEYRVAAVFIILVTILTCSEGRPTIASRRDRCSGTPADVAFVLDSSNSIWLPDFARELTFVKDVISSFDVGLGEEQTRVGAMTFGHGVWPQFYMDTYSDADEMLRAVDRIAHGRGKRTNTGDAITFMRDIMFSPRAGARENVTRIAIVITDGRSQKTLVTQNNAADAHTDGIKIFSISVGFRLDKNELKGIASNPDDEYFFNIDDFEAFDMIKEKVTSKACEVALPLTAPIPGVIEFPVADIHTDMEKCKGKKADIFILIDSSFSIEKDDFAKELQFVRSFINVLDIGPNKTKVGIMTFSDDVKFIVRLNYEMAKEDYRIHLDAISYMGQGTDTATALRRMREEGFAPSVARQDAAHIAIVLTDGLSRDPDHAAKEAEFAQMMGIQIFSVGIGHGIDKLELTDMASNPDENFVYHVDSFDSLQTIKMNLAAGACALDPIMSYLNPNDQATCSPRKSTDLLFVYDASNLGSRKTQAISQFISASLSDFSLKSDLLRVGREIQNCPDGNVPLGSALNGDDLSMVKYFTLTDLLKRIRRNTFSVENGARSGGMKIVVLFLDKDQTVTYETYQELKLLKDFVDVLYLVTVGQNGRTSFFTNMAGEGYYLQAQSYDQLNTLTSNLKDDLCEFFSSAL